MGNHLAGGDDQIILFVHDASVDLDADTVVPEAFGYLLKIFLGNFPDLFDIRAPVVHDHLIVGDIAEHLFPLLLRDGHVGTESRHYIDFAAFRRQFMIYDLRYEAGI